MENFRCNCDLSDSGMSAENIFNLLPPFPTNILNVLKRGCEISLYELRFTVALFTEEDIKSWQKAYEKKSKCTYFIRSTENRTGRYVKFKQRLYCHHNTGDKNVYEQPGLNRKKNTNCPSSIKITLRAVKKRYQGKNKDNAPDPNMPCEITLIPTHNHVIQCTDARDFREVSDETRNKLIELFKSGHTAASALKTLKIDIQLQHNNYDEILSVRHLCPDYDYCYRLYKNQFKKGAEDTASVQPIVNEEIIAKGKCLIEKISEKCVAFLNKSPEKAVSGLQMLDDNFGKLKTVRALVSSCATFGQDFHTKSKRNRISAQPSAISKRKLKMKGSNNPLSVHNYHKREKITLIITNETN